MKALRPPVSQIMATPSASSNFDEFQRVLQQSRAEAPVAGNGRTPIGKYTMSHLIACRLTSLGKTWSRSDADAGSRVAFITLTHPRRL